MSLVPSAEWVDVVFPMSSVPPYLIEQRLNSIRLTLYGTTATPETIKFLQNDSLVRMINWVPEATDRLRFDLEPMAGAADFRSRWVKYLQLKPQIQKQYPQAVRVDLRFKNQVIVRMKDDDTGENIVWGLKKNTL